MLERMLNFTVFLEDLIQRNTLELSHCMLEVLHSGCQCSDFDKNRKRLIKHRKLAGEIYLLAEHSDTKPFQSLDGPGVRCFSAIDQPEDGRLSGTISAYQPDVLAR